MTDDTANQVFEHLCCISSKVEKIDQDLDWIERRLAAIDGQFRSLVLTSAAQSTELAKIGRRLDRIEKRLELSDG